MLFSFFSRLLVVFIFFAPSSLWAICAGSSSVWTAANCSYTEVAACVSGASNGDTINVPPGSCTWGSTLTIPEGKTIYLVGAGSAEAGTVISGTRTFITSFSDGTRISGFRFLFSGASADPLLSVRGHGFRVDNNYMENVGDYASVWSECINASAANLVAQKLPEGVIYNNTLMHCKIGTYGTAVLSKDVVYWKDASNIGTSRMVYFEDNVIDRGISTSVLSDSNYSGSYVLRYNSLVDSDAMVHSVQGNSRAGRNWEFYGNSWTFNTNSNLVAFIRGGTGMMFNNQVTGTPSSGYEISLDNVRTFTNYGPPAGQCDGNSAWDGNTTGQSGWPCRDQIGRGQDAAQSSSSDMKAQASEPAYFWGNYRSTGTVIAPSIANGSDSWIQANRDYYAAAESFDGTSGVGCGTLASRPATCTTGVGYWATNQSCTDLTGMVGTNPLTPISGTLYKCTATDTWTASYTPYAYPHPLRGAAAQEYTLTITLVGRGTITTADGGINCGETCTYDYTTGAGVIIQTPVPTDGFSYFSGWSGDCSGTGSQALTMSAAKACTATFAEYGRGTMNGDGIMEMNGSGSVEVVH